MTRTTQWTASLIVAAGIFVSGAMTNQAAAQQPGSAQINGRAYSADQLHGMGVRGTVRPGNYWYDRRSGAWGIVGTGALGAVRAGLPLGRMKLPRTGTHVFINGREITRGEAMFLYGLFGRYTPGRYFVNADGGAGFEGGPVRVNLIQLYLQSKRQRSIRTNGMFSKGGCSGGYCSFVNTTTGKHTSWPN